MQSGSFSMSVSDLAEDLVVLCLHSGFQGIKAGRSGDDRGPGLVADNGAFHALYGVFLRDRAQQMAADVDRPISQSTAAFNEQSYAFPHFITHLLCGYKL